MHKPCRPVTQGVGNARWVLLLTSSEQPTPASIPQVRDACGSSPHLGGKSIPVPGMDIRFPGVPARLPCEHWWFGQGEGCSQWSPGPPVPSLAAGLLPRPHAEAQQECPWGSFPKVSTQICTWTCEHLWAKLDVLWRKPSL